MDNKQLRCSASEAVNAESQNIEIAYEKLKNMTLFSEDFTSFEVMFAELLHEGKEKEALAYVLKVTFRLLKSEGEVFNEILALTPEAKSKELSTWVRTTRGTLK